MAGRGEETEVSWGLLARLAARAAVDTGAAELQRVAGVDQVEGAEPPLPAQPHPPCEALLVLHTILLLSIINRLDCNSTYASQASKKTDLQPGRAR